MNRHWDFFDNFFAESHKSLTKGLIFLGTCLVLFAFLIFMYPSLNGFIFAGFIMAGGIFALILGYRVWKFKARIETYSPSFPAFKPVRYNAPSGYYRKRTFIIR